MYRARESRTGQKNSYQTAKRELSRVSFVSSSGSHADLGVIERAPRIESPGRDVASAGVPFLSMTPSNEASFGAELEGALDLKLVGARNAGASSDSCLGINVMGFRVGVVAPLRRVVIGMLIPTKRREGVSLLRIRCTRWAAGERLCISSCILLAFPIGEEAVGRLDPDT
uniref:Uncharacterized protein n=1 Tax=Lotharella oceanica TaxID=641309 RepID=A0A7S2TV80_9EUKA|mmetsp:Transcript_29128/g.54542  ORF Transcript_29128/g.54542 Transcript_29128/m.54542 type:complete len:170 (+) Transcript_29128:107-616(+)